MAAVICNRCQGTMEPIGKMELAQKKGWKNMSDGEQKFWLCKNPKCEAWKSQTKGKISEKNVKVEGKKEIQTEPADKPE